MLYSTPWWMRPEVIVKAPRAASQLELPVPFKALALLLSKTTSLCQVVPVHLQHVESRRPVLWGHEVWAWR